MRLHTTTTLGLSTLAILALAGCSHRSSSASAAASSAATPAHRGGTNASASTPLSLAALAQRLLNESDLGDGYTRKPETPEQHDDVTVIGCPALENLGGDAAAGGSLDFTRKAKASFIYADGSDSKVSEELYSDTAQKLSEGMGRIFQAMTSCPTYQVLIGSTSITITGRKAPVAELGDGRWSQLLTFTVGGRSSTIKQTAIRSGRSSWCSLMRVRTCSSGVMMLSRAQWPLRDRLVRERSSLCDRASTRAVILDG